jgi:hypothetical protein
MISLRILHEVQTDRRTDGPGDCQDALDAPSSPMHHFPTQPSDTPFFIFPAESTGTGTGTGTGKGTGTGTGTESNAVEQNSTNRA